MNFEKMTKKEKNISKNKENNKKINATKSYLIFRNSKHCHLGSLLRVTPLSMPIPNFVRFRSNSNSFP